MRTQQKKRAKLLLFFEMNKYFFTFLQNYTVFAAKNLEIRKKSVIFAVNFG